MKNFGVEWTSLEHAKASVSVGRLAPFPGRGRVSSFGELKAVLSTLAQDGAMTEWIPVPHQVSQKGIRNPLYGQRLACQLPFRVLHFKDSSSVPESALAAHFHWVFHCVIPESQLSGVLARR